MKRLAATFALLCAVTAPPHAQSPDLIIRGRVVSSETGDPLPHARVAIYNDAAPLPPLFTDAEGRFASRPLEAGRYRLAVTKAGFALTSVARPDTAPAEGVAVRMPRSSAIAGRVVDGFGEPAVGVRMQLLTRAPDRTRLGAALKVATTDDLGDYRFGGLAEGTYVVSSLTQRIDPTTARVVQAAVYYPGVTGIPEAQDITLRAGDEKSGVDFSGVGSQANEFTVTSQIVTQPNVVLVGPAAAPTTPAPVHGGSVVRGRITRQDGLPLPHATVTTQAPQSFLGRTLNGTRAVQTDEEGLYEFPDLPAGTYRINASKLGYTSWSFGQRTETDRGTSIDLEDGQTRARVDIVLPRYSAVMGRILDEFGDPVESVAVSISQIRFQGGRRRLAGVNGITTQATDDLGRYRLYGLQRGEYIVNASAGQVTAFAAGPELSGYAPTYFPGTTNPREAQLVAVPRSQDVTGVDLVLVPTPTATLSGRKLGSDGEPLGGSLVLMPSLRSGAIVTPPTGARIYDDGRFEFPNVAPGDYVIQADRGKPNAGVEGEFVAQFVTVNGADVPDLLLQATPGSTISGRVVFDGEVPANLTAFSVIPVRADLDRTPLSGGGIAQGEVAADLTFVMSGIHGPRRLSLDRPPAGWVLKSVLVNGIDATDAPLPFGTDDDSIADVQVVLTNRLTELTGTATDARGQPATGYTVLVFPSDRDQWYPGSRFFRRAAPVTAGTFTVRGLPPSDYIVAAVSGMRALVDGADAWQDPEFLETIAPRAARITLTEGQKLSVSPRVITP